MKKISKQAAALFLILALVVAFIPQMSFADTMPTYVKTIGMTGNDVCDKISSRLKNIAVEDTAIKVEPEGAIAEDYVTISKLGSYTVVTYYPLTTEEITFTAYNKNNPDLYVTWTNSFSEPEVNNWTIYLDEDPQFTFGSNKDLPFSYSVADPDIVSVDDNGYITGNKVGKTTLTTSYGDFKKVDNITVEKNPNGFYYNGEKITELNWNAKERGPIIELDTIKYLNGIVLTDSLTTCRYYFSTNTDVAEPEYNQEGINIHQGTGKIITKKNGTALIYVYYDTQHSQLIGKLKINVTGFDETTNPDAGWIEVTGPQSANNNASYAAIQLINDGLSVYNKSFNEATIQNKIAQYIKADTAAFSLKITSGAKVDGGSGATDMGYTDEQKAAWEKEVLSRINICEVNEDGTIGKVVASNGDGYELKSSSHTAAKVDITLNIAVKRGTLSKGKTYALVADADVAGIECLEYYQTGINTFTPIGAETSWEFTTVPAAKSIGIVDSDGNSKAKAVVHIDESMTLSAVLNKNENEKIAVDDTILWTSSNSSVASVDQDGKVTGKKAGTAVITAEALYGKVSAKCTITVPPIKVTKVKTSATKATLTVGKDKNLKATVYPANASNKAVIWTSSNKKIAKVSSTGKVTAVAPGQATITVTTKDGKFKAKTVVNVKPKNTSFTLTGKASSITIKYKKVSDVSGYQIYRADSKKGTFKKITTRSQKKIGQYTSLKLKKNKTYYYKMRTYKTVNGKRIYSSFSGVKTVKTK